MSKSTYERAIVHQTKQIEKYTRLVEGGDLKYKFMLKSAKVSLEALLMVKEYMCEDMVMTRVNASKEADLCAPEPRETRKSECILE